jgi:queuine tRNA-ribosyltransferase
LSVDRTIAWARQCRLEFDRQIQSRRVEPGSRPLLFAVVQGGHDRDLRRRCGESLANIGFDGYGFGGWPIDDQKRLDDDALGWAADSVPAGSPLHALGVGKPENVVEKIENVARNRQDRPNKDVVLNSVKIERV